MSTIPQPAVFRSMDVSSQIAELRREIEGIRELNTIYVARKYHANRDSVANERRRVRLEEIMQQLAALRSTQTRQPTFGEPACHVENARRYRPYLTPPIPDGERRPSARLPKLT